MTSPGTNSFTCEAKMKTCYTVGDFEKLLGSWGGNCLTVPEEANRKNHSQKTRPTHTQTTHRTDDERKEGSERSVALVFDSTAVSQAHPL